VADTRGTETILVVDDEEAVRGLCTAVLTGAGYNVISAEDGYLALQMCKSGPVHLALLDVRMPRMSGPELIVELLDCLVPQNLDIRFILMSGYADPDMGDPPHRTHRRYSFLQKPFTPAALLDAVRRELDFIQRKIAP